MRRAVLAIAFGAAVSASTAFAKTAPATPGFEDDVCPQANPAGRYLNALNASGSTDTDVTIYAAQRLIDAYHDCARAYDRAYVATGEPDPEDRAFSHRIYARLELALAYQRVGLLAEQLREPDSARAQYDGALQTLDEIEHVVRPCPLRATSATGKLVAQARDLAVALTEVEADLRPTQRVSPAPIVPSG